MVVVEGLAFGIFFEERLLQAREQALVVDIGAGIMDEDARFDIAIGIVNQTPFLMSRSRNSSDVTVSMFFRV